MQSSSDIDKYVNNEYLSQLLGVCTVSVTRKEESRMNYDKLYFGFKTPETFTNSELFLNYCNEVFKYWHEHKENFNPNECSRVTEISLHHVKKIFNKYLKEK